MFKKVQKSQEMLDIIERAEVALAAGNIDKEPMDANSFWVAGLSNSLGLNSKQTNDVRRV